MIALVLVMSMAQFFRRDPGQMGLSPYGEHEIKLESLKLPVRGFSFQEAIHTRQFWLLCAIYFGSWFALNPILVHIVIHATGLGISAASAAIILAIIGGAKITGAVIMGSAADRIGNKPAIIIALILMSMALLWLLVAKEVWMFYLFAAVFGFAWGGLGSIQSPIVAELFGLSSHGVILGFVFFTDCFGGAIGTVLAGRIFDVTVSYQLAFLICAVFSVVCIIFATLLRPVSGAEGRNESRKSP